MPDSDTGRDTRNSRYHILDNVRILLFFFTKCITKVVLAPKTDEYQQFQRLLNTCFIIKGTVLLRTF